MKLSKGEEVIYHFGAIIEKLANVKIEVITHVGNVDLATWKKAWDDYHKDQENEEIN